MRRLVFTSTVAAIFGDYADVREDRGRMVSVNPGLILGPSLTPASDSGSLFLLDELFKGYFFYGAPDFSFTTADVRDVATPRTRSGPTPTAAAPSPRRR